MVIMTSGMAHVSGGIMAMYISQGVEAGTAFGGYHDVSGYHPGCQNAGA